MRQKLPHEDRDNKPFIFDGYSMSPLALGVGQGVLVFYGMAKPVKSPLIGPVRAPSKLSLETVLTAPSRPYLFNGGKKECGR